MVSLIEKQELFSSNVAEFTVSLVLVLMEGEIVILGKTLQFLFISVEERIL